MKQVKNCVSSVCCVSVIVALVIICLNVYLNYQEEVGFENIEWTFDIDKMPQDELRDAIENSFQWLENEEKQQPGIQCRQVIEVWRGIRNMARTNALLMPFSGKFKDIIEKAVLWIEKKDLPYEVSLEGQTPGLKHSIIVNTMYSPLDKWFEQKRLTCLENYWSEKKRSNCLEEYSEDPRMQLLQCPEKKIMEKPWIECEAECLSLEKAIDAVKKSQDEYKEAIEKAMQWFEKDEIFSEVSVERPTLPTVDDVFDELARTFDTISWALEKWLEKKRFTCSLYYSKREL